MNRPDPMFQRSVADELCRVNLFALTWRVFDELHRGSRSAFVPNWHVEALCHELEELQRGENLRLVITVPPRHLKSIATAVAFPAYLLGRDPSCKIIVASYGLDLARKHSEDFRRVLESNWYRRLFPHTRIAARGARQDEIRTVQGGGRKAVSIGGAVTGFGADYLVVDDLLKAADASSEVERERARTYLEGSLMSRFDDPRNMRVVRSSSGCTKTIPPAIFWPRRATDASTCRRLPKRMWRSPSAPAAHTTARRVRRSFRNGWIWPSLSGCAGRWARPSSTCSTSRTQWRQTGRPSAGNGSALTTR